MINYGKDIRGEALLSSFKYDNCAWCEQTQSFIYYIDFKKTVKKVRDMIAKYGKRETARKLNEFDRVMYLCMTINVNGWSMLNEGYSVVDSGLSDKLKELTTYHELGHMNLRFVKTKDSKFDPQDENLANMMGMRLMMNDGILNDNNYEEYFTDLYKTKDINRARVYAPEFVDKFYIDKKDLKNNYCDLWKYSKKLPVTIRKA